MQLKTFAHFILLVLGLFGAYFLGLVTPSQEADITPAALRISDDYEYVSPLLLCGASGGTAPNRDRDFEDLIEGVLHEQLSEDTEASVYYRDLNTGAWFTLNEEKVYNPSSLLKVPLAIAYFKQAETREGFLEEKVVYTGGGEDLNEGEYFRASLEAEVGSSYTVTELIRLMLRYSDNISAHLLYVVLPDDVKMDVYTDLGLDFAQVPASEPHYMSVLDYMRFFRVLYNGTYLTPENSNLFMSWLTESRFPAGISQGVPEDVRIAQKFGENTFLDGETTYHELHDCGVVYYPENPYLFCIMTRSSTSFESLSKLIQVVSQRVYDEVDRRFSGAVRVLD